MHTLLLKISLVCFLSSKSLRFIHSCIPVLRSGHDWTGEFSLLFSSSQLPQHYGQLGVGSCYTQEPVSDNRLEI